VKVRLHFEGEGAWFELDYNTPGESAHVTRADGREIIRVSLRDLREIHQKICEEFPHWAQ